MNLTMTAILVLLLSFNTLAEELPLELQAPETASVKKMSVPSETLMKLMEERQQDLDRREAAVRRFPAIEILLALFHQLHEGLRRHAHLLDRSRFRCLQF